jgi:hypothetical protein
MASLLWSGLLFVSRNIEKRLYGGCVHVLLAGRRRIDFGNGAVEVILGRYFYIVRKVTVIKTRGVR